MIREMQIRNYSQRTITSYVASISKLAKFFNQPVEAITISQLKDYLHHRATVEQISVSMINQCISAFKIIQQDVLGRDWEPIKLKRPRREQKLPVVLSFGEVASMISKTKNIKHRAIIATAYSTGMRRQEVQLMEAGHVDSERMQVYVANGKGKKARYTLLSEKTLILLRDYYRTEWPTRYLFEPNGRKGHVLSATTLNNIVKQAAKRAGITKNISFHSLRHTFATHLLENGINLRLIQQFMGHHSIKTTSRYLHIARIDLAQVRSPLDDMDL